MQNQKFPNRYHFSKPGIALILLTALMAAVFPAHTAYASQNEPAFLDLGGNLPGLSQDQPPGGPVSASTPNEDGSITHIVQYGETLIDIAQAYGISLQELYNRNRSLNPDKPTYFEGQVIIIRAPFTETPFMTETYTPRPPTRTPMPTRTPRPSYTPTPNYSPTPSRTPTGTPLIKIPTIDDMGSSRPVVAYAFIGVSLVGLVALFIIAFLPRKL